MAEGSAIKELLKKALCMRRKLFENTSTNVFRLLNAEGDGLPGIMLDRYGDFGVARVVDPGVRAVAPGVYRAAMEIFGFKGLYEKGPAKEGFHAGQSTEDRPVLGEVAPDTMHLREGGMVLEARLNEGARTGIYPDQRENRELLAPLVRGCRVLNTFSYTGAFSISAALHGAEETVSVDLSGKALDWSRQNFKLNGIDLDRHRHVKADVFDYLKLAGKKGLAFGLVILDPVTFSTSRKGMFRAVKDWPRLIGNALMVLEKGGRLAVSCNTRQISENGMRAFIGEAAREEDCRIKIEAVRGLPADFPTALKDPGMAYLKFILGRRD